MQSHPEERPLLLRMQVQLAALWAESFCERTGLCVELVLASGTHAKNLEAPQIAVERVFGVYGSRPSARRGLRCQLLMMGCGRPVLSRGERSAQRAQTQQSRAAKCAAL